MSSSFHMQHTYGAFEDIFVADIYMAIVLYILLQFAFVD